MKDEIFFFDATFPIGLGIQHARCKLQTAKTSSKHNIESQSQCFRMKSLIAFTLLFRIVSVTSFYCPSQKRSSVPEWIASNVCTKSSITRLHSFKDDADGLLVERTPFCHKDEACIRDEIHIDSSRRDFIMTLATSGILFLSPIPSEAIPATSTATATATAKDEQDNPSTNVSPPSITMTDSSLTFQEILSQASKKALSGGKAGATASVVQVLSLMWLRTSMNYQYRYGGSLSSSLSELYKEGGIPRFYQGLPFALVQGPLTRFGDTAANVGILALLDASPLPLFVKTGMGSICAGLWRIFLMPIDTSKTIMQVEGKDALNELFNQVKETGPGRLYRGALASAAATAVGHFPWFLTYNFLNEALPTVDTMGLSADEHALLYKLLRSALLGLSASCASDICSNSLRVIKTTKQTASFEDIQQIGNDTLNRSKDSDITYREAVALILEKDGWIGLFGRGLQTRLLTNAIQGAAFSVLWRYFQEAYK